MFKIDFRGFGGAEVISGVSFELNPTQKEPLGAGVDEISLFQPQYIQCTLLILFGFLGGAANSFLVLILCSPPTNDAIGGRNL